MNDTIISQYIGVKLINARPMTRLAYNELRGWTLPADENPEDDGYLVEYMDGGQANHPGFIGYISWSPKDVFERAYRPTHGMTFGLAIEAMKQGAKVARTGWNGKGMWLQLVIPHSNRAPETPTAMVLSIPNGVDTLPWIGMKTADNKFVPWLASQTDMLSEDWMIVE